MRFNCLKVPIIIDTIQILPIKKFIEKVDKKERGIIFCQVNKIPIINHEMNLDILISQKCRGPIAIFKQIKSTIKVILLLKFSNCIDFSIVVQEKRHTNKKAEAKDWIKKYIKKHSFFLISSSDRVIQINIIDLISKVIHRKSKEELAWKIKGRKISMLQGRKLYINKKSNFQWGMSPIAFIAYFIFFITI